MNNYTEEELENIKNVNFKYLVVGKEIGESGTPHLQGYIEFENARQLGGVKKLIGNRAHLETRRGTAVEASEYCKKDNEFEEFGTLSNQGKRSDLDEVKARLEKGENLDNIIIDDPVLYCKYRNGIRDIADIYARNRKRTKMTEGIWYWGSTGVGKSHKAFEEAGEDVYVWVDDNGWWDGYSGQKTVIINDFRGAIKYGELLQLVDKWPYKVKRRGREPMPFTSEKIIITSSLRPEYIYTNLVVSDSLDQLRRRFTIINLRANGVSQDFLDTEVLQGNTVLAEDE